MRLFWVMHAHYSEGRTFLAQALTESEGIVESGRMKALYAAAKLALMQGDNDQAEALCEESLALYREIKDTQGVVRCLNLLGDVAATRGNLPAARLLIEEALSLAREGGDKESVAWSLFTLAEWDRTRGEYTRARALFEETLAMQRALGNRGGVADALLNLAAVLVASQGDSAMIHSLLEEGFALAREVGNKEDIAAYYWLSGRLALSQGDAVTAYSLAEESMALFREIGHRHGTSQLLSLLAQAAAAQGDYVAARAFYEESLVKAMEGDFKAQIASGLEGLASVVAIQREPTWAAQLWGAAERLRETIDVPLPPIEHADYERLVTTARAQLGESAFAVTWVEGRTMTPEQAFVSEGREMVSPPTTTVAAPSPTYPAGLTAREVQVLRLVAGGLTNIEIAEELRLSEKTIAHHLTHIFNKTTSENRAAAAAFAIRNGLA